MDSNGSVWVLIGHYAFMWVLMGPFIYFCFLLDSNGSLWVLIVPSSSLRILLGSYGSFLACLHVHFWEPVLSSSA